MCIEFNFINKPFAFSVDNLNNVYSVVGKVIHGFDGLTYMKLLNFIWYDTGNNESYAETKKVFCNDVVANKSDEAILVAKNYLTLERMKLFDKSKMDFINNRHQIANEFKNQSLKRVKIFKTNRRKKDIVKIIASNIKLKNFINWKPKYNSLNKIVRSCLIWEKKI